MAEGSVRRASTTTRGRGFRPARVFRTQAYFRAASAGETKRLYRATRSRRPAQLRCPSHSSPNRRAWGAQVRKSPKRLFVENACFPLR